MRSVSQNMKTTSFDKADGFYCTHSVTRTGPIENQLAYIRVFWAYDNKEVTIKGGRCVQSITAQDVISGMKNHFDAQAAKGFHAVVTYQLAGEHGGVWTLRVQNGNLEVDEGMLSGESDATVSMSAQDFVKVALGELNPMNAFMTGKIKIDGNPFVAQKIQGFFKRPS